MVRLIFGNTGSYLVTLLAMPVLSRIYTPEQFGTVSTITAIALVISAAASLSYDTVLLNVDEVDAGNLLALSILATTLVTVLTAATVGAVRAFATIPLKNADSIRYWYSIPIMVFSIGLSNVLNEWFVRNGQFRVLARRKVIGNLVAAGVQIAFGFIFGGGFVNLLFGTVLGYVLSAFVMYVAYRQLGKVDRKVLSWSRMNELIKRYPTCPLLMTPSRLVYLLAWQAPVFLLGSFFDERVVGFYSQGLRLIQMPLNLVSVSVSQVFYHKAANTEKAKLGHAVLSTFDFVFTISLIPTVILALFGYELFSVLLGAVWADAGLYTQVLSLWALVWFISTPLSRIFFLLERHGFMLKLNLVILATRAASIVAGGLANSPLLSIVLMSVTGFVVYGFMNYRIMTTAGIRARTILTSIWQVIRRNLIFIGLLSAAKLIPFPMLVKVIVVATLSLVWLLFYLRKIRGSTREPSSSGDPRMPEENPLDTVDRDQI